MLQIKSEWTKDGDKNIFTLFLIREDGQVFNTSFTEGCMTPDKVSKTLKAAIEMLCFHAFNESESIKLQEEIHSTIITDEEQIDRSSEIKQEIDRLLKNVEDKFGIK